MQRTAMEALEADEEHAEAFETGHGDAAGAASTPASRSSPDKADHPRASKVPAVRLRGSVAGTSKREELAELDVEVEAERFRRVSQIDVGMGDSPVSTQPVGRSSLAGRVSRPSAARRSIQKQFQNEMANQLRPAAGVLADTQEAGDEQLDHDTNRRSTLPPLPGGLSPRPTPVLNLEELFKTSSAFSVGIDVGGETDPGSLEVQRFKQRYVCSLACEDTACCQNNRCAWCRANTLPVLDCLGDCVYSLPCFDETDDGVPPFCRDKRCPLDHRNPIFNDSDCCVRWGNVGYQWFDEHRKPVMGFATMMTIFSMVVTTAGAFSLSTDDGVIRRTHWVQASSHNSTLASDVERVYIGLNTAVQEVCADWLGDACLHWKTVKIDLGFFLFPISEDACQDEATRFMEIPGAAYALCSNCRAASVGMQLGAFLSCVSLIFALMGTTNRMRRISDAPVQKLLGCVTDTWGALSLIYGISEFSLLCFDDIKAFDESGLQIDLSLGPGFGLYIFCAFAGLVRAVAHWLTPLPGQGAGACSWKLPVNLNKINEAALELSLIARQHTAELRRRTNEVRAGAGNAATLAVESTRMAASEFGQGAAGATQKMVDTTKQFGAAVGGAVVDTVGTIHSEGRSLVQRAQSIPSLDFANAGWVTTDGSERRSFSEVANQIDKDVLPNGKFSNRSSRVEIDGISRDHHENVEL